MQKNFFNRRRIESLDKFFPSHSNLIWRATLLALFDKLCLPIFVRLISKKLGVNSFLFSTVQCDNNSLNKRLGSVFAVIGIKSLTILLSFNSKGFTLDDITFNCFLESFKDYFWTVDLLSILGKLSKIFALFEMFSPCAFPVLFI